MRPLLAIALSFVTATLTFPAFADDCAPTCRPGFLCHEGKCISACNPACESGLVCTPKGQCVSPCNPPCGAGETCNASRVCEGPPATSKATASKPSSATNEGGADASTSPDASSNASLHFTAAVGGISIPDTATAGAAQAGIIFARPNWRSDVRLFGAAYHVSTDNSKTTGAMFSSSLNWWFGVYGLGFGSGLGYASAERYNGTNGTASIAVFVVPVQFAFGKKPRFEISLTGGAIRFLSIEEFSPWGYLAVGLAL